MTGNEKQKTGGGGKQVVRDLDVERWRGTGGEEAADEDDTGSCGTMRSDFSIPEY
mgnify:CR=1 FL=1